MLPISKKPWTSSAGRCCRPLSLLRRVDFASFLFPYDAMDNTGRACQKTGNRG